MPTTLARWRENVFAPFETGFFPFAAPEIRIEQLVEADKFMVRAELPGVNPEKDVDVSVVNGMLSIRAERTEEKRDRTHSEFHYGQLVRTLPLPAGAREDTAHATYTNGILEISFDLGEPEPAGRHIEIEVGKEAGAQAAAKAKK
ncbi:MAG TPA: Hsp20/alpha crystallin family protein [Micromonosporaceae bacterium]